MDGINKGHIGEYNHADGFIQDVDYANAGGNAYAADCMTDPLVMEKKAKYETCKMLHGSTNDTSTNDTSTNDKTPKKENFFNRFMGGVFQVIDAGDKTIDALNKYKNEGKGQPDVEDVVGGVDAYVDLNKDDKQSDDTKIWYIAGGVIILVVIAGVVLTKK